MIERDRKQELRTGGGCLLILAVLFALAFARTYWRLLDGESAHALLWPIHRAFGPTGVLVVGIVVTAMTLVIAVYALKRSR